MSKKHKKITITASNITYRLQINCDYATVRIAPARPDKQKCHFMFEI